MAIQAVKHSCACSCCRNNGRGGDGNPRIPSVFTGLDYDGSEIGCDGGNEALWCVVPDGIEAFKLAVHGAVSHDLSPARHA